MKNLIDGKTKELEFELKKYNKELERLKEISDNNEEKIKEELCKAKIDSKNEIEDFLDKRKVKFEKNLEKIDNQELVEITYHNEIENTIEKIKDVLYYYFEKIISNEIESLNIAIQNDNLKIVTPEYSEIQSENSQILKMYIAQKTAQKEEIEKIISEKSLNVSDLLEKSDEYNEEYYQNSLKALNDELLKIPMSVAMKESEEQDVQPSQIFKNIGNVIDLGLLFIPGEQIVAGIKGVADVTKIAQLINKSGQFTKVLGGLAKSAPVLDNVRAFG